MFPPDVVVVGAGFAGLSAAVRLASRGARVAVVEERRRLGGRATSFQDAVTGEVVDNGQHAIFGCYHATFEFLRTIGALDDVRLEDRLEIEIVDRAGVNSCLRSTSLPPPLHLVGGLLRWPALGVADRLSALRLGAALRGVRDVASLAQMTVNDWLIAHGQTERLREVLWEPLAVAALNQSPAVAAAATFVECLWRMFNGTRRDSAVGLPLKPLDRWFAEPARDWLVQKGHRFHTGQSARLLSDGDRALGVEVHGERILSGAVVSAVPWFAFPAFADGISALRPIAEHAEAMRPSPIVTVNLWLDRPVTRTAFVGLPRRTFQWVFDKSRLAGSAWSHLSLVSSGADDVVAQSNEALIDLATRELKAALPAAAAATVRRASAVREKRATFSLAPGEPPRPSCETPLSGLVLAGDWTDTGLPATIEGAVVSGHRAAAVLHPDP